jgi:D-alanyl-D-alanine endopeptidase (penicillin-binding protein 7)
MKRLILVAISVLMIHSAHSSPAPSHLVLDISKKEIISSNNEDVIRPIASLTKLMTALIIVESDVDMNEEVIYHGGIWRNKKVKRSDLLESLLIKSDNSAAEALAASYPLGRQQFIKVMNARAVTLNMNNTVFEDPSGLGKHNLSTAKDLAVLVTKAYEHPEISNTSASKYFKVEIKNKRKITYMAVNNTNSQLLNVFGNITLSKTGFTNPAGRCLALIVENNSNKYAIIILGEKTSGDRFYRARTLINMVSE